MDKEPVGTKINIPSAKPNFPDIDEILVDIGKVLESGRLILGEYTARFEECFKEYIGVKHAIAVSSATAALEITMRFFNVRGKEVILPVNTFIACPNSVIYAGGTPIFADIEPNSYCIDPNDVLKKLTPNTKGVMAVHLAGLPVPGINEIRGICKRHGLFLIEDASHAHGAMIDNTKVGALGDAGCFSFYPTKNMTTGVGGMITTNNDSLAAFARSVRHHGQGESLDSIVNFGNDWLLDEIRAVLGIHQVRNLEYNVKQRNEIAATYMAGINLMGGITFNQVPRNMRHGYYKFLAKLDEDIDKASLVKAMRNQHNIEIGTLYQLPCHLHPIYRQLGYKEGMFPVSERELKRQISLPVFVQMKDEEVAEVLDSLGEEINRARLRGA